MMARFKLARAITALVLTLSSTASAAPVTFNFTKLVDTNTVVPNGSGTFDSFWEVGVDNGNVAFEASDSSNGRGLYMVNNSTLTAVFLQGDSVPGTTETVEYINDNVQYQNGKVIGRITDTSSTKHLIEADETGITRVIATAGVTQVPGMPSGTVFTGFDSGEGWGFDGARTVFKGFFDTGRGLFLDVNGTLSAVALNGDPSPTGAGTLSAFEDPMVDANGDGIVFVSTDTSGAGWNLVVSDNGVVTSILTPSGTPIPGGTGNFDTSPYHNPDIDAGQVVFTGGQSAISQSGVYLHDGSDIQLIVDKNTTLPSGDLFSSTGTGHAALSDGTIAFFANDSDLVVWRGDTLYNVLSVGDVLDGMTVEYINANKRQNLDGNFLGLDVTFTDNSAAVYVVEISSPSAAVPEPSSITMLGLGAMILGSVWYGRRKQNSGAA